MTRTETTERSTVAGSSPARPRSLTGLGWGLTGACPGPIFALIGNGMTVYGVVLVSALVGTWFYGVLRPRLPHYQLVL